MYAFYFIRLVCLLLMRILASWSINTLYSHLAEMTEDSVDPDDGVQAAQDPWETGIGCIECYIECRY